MAVTFDREQYPFLDKVKNQPGRGTMWTPDFDNHFPHQNQTKHCWANYVEFHKCKLVKGEESPVCRKFFRTYKSLCPLEWVEEWDGQRERGVFPGQQVWQHLENKQE
eukprot:TRINITY_DN1178_c0_g1_i2.p1 TRINITY_DN1178_c0_g1~~TRINITY_DN1178_c0_g1_i2.p1  ORF type:complete len:107 (-),score=21.97 TRINITY_DN1178_c0_g1_i2:282-602(-)